MTSYVFNQPIGGFGNQMFNIFTTLSYAIDNNKEPIFIYKEKNKNVIRSYNRYTYWNNFLMNLRQQTTIHKKKQKIYDAHINEAKKIIEKVYNYEELEKSEDNVSLAGYFQSYKYFEHNYQNICDMIKLDNIQSNTYEKYKEQYFCNDYKKISMHFRLGDYKQLTNYHVILNSEYYEKALNFIINDDITYQVLYFCEAEDDDYVLNVVDYLREKNKNIIFMKVSNDIEDWEQILLMSLCNHNIIANSTFSWWGAYFNKNNDKIVCYPSVWSTKDVDTKDVFPENWKKI